MFNNKKASEEASRETAVPTLSIIAAGTVIDGNVISDGDIRIEGRILGGILCRSRLVVGAAGKIEGNVDALNATIAGEVHGGVVVREVLQIQESGRIYGDISTQKFVMQAGGLFTGRCRMGPEAVEVFKQIPALSDSRRQPAPLHLESENGSANGYVEALELHPEA